MKERTYAVKYREKYNKSGVEYETFVTAQNGTQARYFVSQDLQDLGEEYTITSVVWERR